MIWALNHLHGLVTARVYACLPTLALTLARIYPWSCSKICRPVSASKAHPSVSPPLCPDAARVRPAQGQAPTSLKVLRQCWGRRELLTLPLPLPACLALCAMFPFSLRPRSGGGGVAWHRVMSESPRIGPCLQSSTGGPACSGWGMGPVVQLRWHPQGSLASSICWNGAQASQSRGESHHRATCLP